MVRRYDGEARIGAFKFRRQEGLGALELSGSIFWPPPPGAEADQSVIVQAL